MQNLICLFCIQNFTKELFGFMKNQMLNLSEGLLNRIGALSNKIRALSNVSVDERVCYFIKSTNLHNPQLYILHNYFLDERDPPWINNEIKKLINEKNSAYKSHCHFQRDVFLFGKFKVPIKYVN